MSGFPGGHAGFLVAALATHAVVGYALGTVLCGRGWAGLVGGVVADVDLLVPGDLGFPWAHRSLTHAPLVGLLVVAGLLLWVRRTGLDRRVGYAVGLGYASQLLIDLTTPQGLPLAYPLSDAFVSLHLDGHSLAATVVLWVVSLGLLWVDRVGAAGLRERLDAS
ncbi:metal-dependent hydrolase [Halobacteriales archaeon Cl-PHB]